MKKFVPVILQVVGLLLLIYGIYQVFAPEASVNIEPINETVQDNNDAYVNIVIGIASIGLGYFMHKKK